MSIASFVANQAQRTIKNLRHTFTLETERPQSSGGPGDVINDVFTSPARAFDDAATTTPGRILQSVGRAFTNPAVLASVGAGVALLASAPLVGIAAVAGLGVVSGTISKFTANMNSLMGPVPRTGWSEAAADSAAIQSDYSPEKIWAGQPDTGWQKAFSMLT